MSRSIEMQTDAKTVQESIMGSTKEYQFATGDVILSQ